MQIKRERPPRHVSKFRDNAKDEYTKQKVDHKTMGQAKVPLRQPESFMKKHEREPVLPDRREFHYPDEERRRTHSYRPPFKWLHKSECTKVA